MKLFETEKNKEHKKLRMSQDREWKNIVEDAEETTKELCEKYYEGKWKLTFELLKLTGYILKYTINLYELFVEVKVIFHYIPRINVNSWEK